MNIFLIKAKFYIKKNYHWILLSILLLTILIVSLHNGKYIISNDNYSAELNPAPSISRYLFSPAWRSYRALGVPSDSEQTDLFRSVAFWVLELFLPTWLVGQLYYWICMVIGSFSMAFLVSNFLKETKQKKYARFTFLFAGVTYISTLWTMWLYYQNMAPYIANYGFLPLLLLAIYCYIKRQTKKRALFLFLASIIFTAVCIISTLFIVDCVLIFSYVAFLILYSKKSLSIGVKTLTILICTQLFWILPFIFYTVSNSQNVISSYVNKTITASTIDLESKMQTAINTARFYNRTMFDTENDEYVFPMANDFNNYDFYKIIGLFPAVFSIFGVIFGFFRSNKKLIYWGIIAFGCWFLIKVINPPLGSLFVWFQDNIPFFKQVFRWPYSKLGLVFLICLTVLSSFGVVYVVSFLSSFIHRRGLKRYLVFCVLSLAILLPLFYSEYIYTGNLYAERAIVDLPSDYYKLEDYLQKTDPTGRIYYAPPANNNYFREYEWGFWGSQFISYIVSNPIMDMSSAVGSSFSENALLDFNDAIRAEDSTKFDYLLQKFDISYILYDASLRADGYSFDVDIPSMLGLFKKYPIIWNYGSLVLYRVDQNDTIYDETLSSSSDNYSFVRDVPANPSLSLDNLNLSNLRIENNNITGEFTYDGNDTYVSSTLNTDYLNNYPARLKATDKGIKVTPSYPYLTDDDTIVQYKVFANSDYTNYIVGDDVIDASLLVNGVTIDSTYKQVNTIYGVKKNQFVTRSLVQDFVKSTGSDCSGSAVVNNTSVKSQSSSSGFLLKGASKLPCIYSAIEDLNYNSKYVVSVSINWEAEQGNYPGVCIYSEAKQKCLNNDKFYDSGDAYGNATITANSVVTAEDNLSIILYATHTDDSFSSAILFKKVDLSYALVYNKLNLTSFSSDIYRDEVYLHKGNTYTVNIPIVYGSSSYTYDKTPQVVWLTNIPDSENDLFSIASTDYGIKQSVQKDYLNETINLFNTTPSSRYLFFWKGENISNIPATLCLVYSTDNKCWVQDMMTLGSKEAEILFFESPSTEKYVNFILSSTSYKLLTENRLESLSLFKYPDVWKNISYGQSSKTAYTEAHLDSVFKGAANSFYSLDTSSISGNALITIPQASSPGWIAIAKENGRLSLLSNSTRVSVDGWKQGWDITNKNIDSVFVLYWPNLLSYLGYILILVMSIYFIKKFAHGRTK